jgi:putative Mg2+ transporter-C (MgtC) family protein
MGLIHQEIMKLLLAVALGGMIGIEREFHDKAAGFRTVILICLGSTLFTMTSLVFSANSDPARIAAQIVTGVGFLGAGAILHDGSRVVGLTTAATIWLAAAIGMLVGTGSFLLAVSATFLAVVVLWFFPNIEKFFNNPREMRTYEVEYCRNDESVKDIESLFLQSGLKVINFKKTASGNEVTLRYTMLGKPAQHLLLSDQVISLASLIKYTLQS